MTNEQIEALKREVSDAVDANPYIHRVDPLACANFVIDYLASQNRLLADGCVGVPMEPTDKLVEAVANVKTGTIEGLDIIVGFSTAMECYKAMIAAQTEKREGD